MSRPDLDPDLQAEYASDSLRPIILFTGLFDSGAARFWTGRGPFEWDGNIFTGSGTLISMTAAEETLQLKASGAAFKLSGLETSLLSAVLDEPMQGRVITAHLGAVDRNMTQPNPPVQIFKGFADQPIIELGAKTCDITIKAENALRDLFKSRVSLYSDVDQQARYPGDTGFRHVAPLNAGVEDLWGNGER